MKLIYFRKIHFLDFLLSWKEKWKVSVNWKNCGKILKWDIYYTTHLEPVADTLIMNCSLSEYVLTDLAHSKYTALFNVDKDGKVCHPSLWRIVIEKLVYVCQDYTFWLVALSWGGEGAVVLNREISSTWRRVLTAMSHE